MILLLKLVFRSILANHACVQEGQYNIVDVIVLRYIDLHVLMPRVWSQCAGAVRSLSVEFT